MSQGLCPSCGAAVNLAAGQDEINCTYCGTLVKRPEAEAQFAEVKNSKFGGTLLIAETAQEGGSYTEALNYYNKVIEQQPDFADAWLNKGICTVRTSKIGDLKIPEAISSWKAAIKFAKKTEAMKKRVAKEIAQTVSDFYPVLESHYEEFKETQGTLSEHYGRFVILVSALTLAQEMDPQSRFVANTGVSLCEAVSKTIKNALPFSSKEFTDKLENIAATFEQTLASVDPEFAKQITVRTENKKLKAVKDEKDAKQGGIGCLMIICIILLFCFGYGAVVRTLKSQGIMETTQEPSEHVGPAIFFSIVSIVLIPVVVVLFRKYKTAGQGDKVPAVEKQKTK